MPRSLASIVGVQAFGTADDLDFIGTSVLVGCSDTLLAEQGKTGEVLVYDSLNLGGGPVARFRIAPTTNEPADPGNPAWSPSTARGCTSRTTSPASTE